MPRYIVQHRYTSNRDGQTWGPWVEDQSIDLRESDAEWVNRDSPGCLVEEGAEPEPETGGEAEEPEKAKIPTQNRQHRGGRNRSV